MEKDQVYEVIETLYMQKIRQILNFSMKKYHKNTMFPIWGTCLGFESMLISFFNYKIPVESKLNDYNVSPHHSSSNL
jgi:hypothetical protein